MKMKVSVSEIKHRNMIFEAGEEETLAWYAREAEKEVYVPQFAREEAVTDHSRINQGALRGTAMHRAMECLDYDSYVTGEDVTAYVEKQLHHMLEAGKMREDELALVDSGKICAFLQTSLASRIVKASREGCLFREQPFVMGIPAKEADPANQSEELVLVQGIIDLYFEEEDHLVLLDYKTDAVHSAKQLIDRYETQMKLYARALEAATGKKVTEKIIYSFRLGETILLS